MAAETLPDRKYDLVVTNLIITPLAAIFVAWKVVVRFRFNPRLGLSEYLMVAGVVCYFRPVELQHFRPAETHKCLVIELCSQYHSHCWHLQRPRETGRGSIPDSGAKNGDYASYICLAVSQYLRYVHCGTEHLRIPYAFCLQAGVPSHYMVVRCSGGSLQFHHPQHRPFRRMLAYRYELEPER
jgi:hypothetical protein